MRELRVAARARRDIDALLRNSEANFGPDIARRYRLLIDEALAMIRSDPERVGVQTHLGPKPGLRLYHLRLARLRLPAPNRIARPRHVLVFRSDGEVVDVVRILHDTMDLPRHMNQG